MTRQRPLRSKRPVVSRQRDGTMRIRYGAFELSKRGAARYDLRDPYYLAVALSWPWFLASLFAVEVALNVVFACLYLLQPGSIANARPGSFGDAFFFSLETLATVGYGEMVPGTLYGHSISACEIMCGMAFIAIGTGLTFVRFSRPRAKILYAATAVVATHRGRRTLMIRLANGRITALTGASARLVALIGETTPEGQFYRTIHDLRLVQSRMPIFALTWTVMHDLEEDGPLQGWGPEELAAADVRLFLTIEARDSTLAADIHDTYGYAADEIRFGHRYADAVSIDAEGRTVADLMRLSLLEPDVGVGPAADEHMANLEAGADEA